MPSTGPIRFCSLPHEEVISATASLRRCKRSLSTPVIIARGNQQHQHERAYPEQFDDGAVAPPKRRLRFWQRRGGLGPGDAAVLNLRKRLGNETTQQNCQLGGRGRDGGVQPPWGPPPLSRGRGGGGGGCLGLAP